MTPTSAKTPTDGSDDAIRKSGRIDRMVAVGWLSAVCVGMGFLVSYETRPGAAAVAPERWPASTRIERAAGRPQLVMFVHPQCPCSRASIGELERLMVHVRDRAEVRVLFLLPDEFDAEWAHSDLWRSAAKFPGVEVSLDERGVEARNFGAATSGHTVLFDREGRLRFSGGITVTRGHFGDSEGRSAILDFLSRDEGPVEDSFPVTKSLVFGCPLFSETTDS